MTNKKVTTGTISITYTPTICHMCSELLARTYTETKDNVIGRNIYVLCGKCVRILPEIIQERLKHPPLDRLNREAYQQ
jgi:bacterioferritin-associated ferredoxin